MIVCPETESAVHTMPAIAITKNIPVVPERPKRSSTTEEMMIVSIVIPETGLRAVVAMALAATEVKKKEKTQGQHQADEGGQQRARQGAEENARRHGGDDHADQDGHDRHVAVGALLARVLAVLEGLGGDRRRSRRRCAAT